MASNDTKGDLVAVGRITGCYGVQGWLRVYSHTSPRDNILGYRRWHLKCGEDFEPFSLAEGRRHGKGVVARLEGIGDRDAAERRVGCDIWVPRDDLGETAPGEYFWRDLEGLEVVTTDGRVLGVIDHLFETGANDVMVVRGDRERLIPFVQPQVVREVDLAGRRMVVDWDPEF
ncbi:MAG: ribosome maturation factor RimM [Pseudomonadota bacterium]